VYYLVEKFDEDIDGELVPSGSHLGGLLAEHIIGRENEVFELHQFHLTEGANAKQLGRKVGLHMVMLS